MNSSPDLTLVIFPTCFGTRNPSPFCLKAEILLRMSGLPYRVERSKDPRVGPMGKLPALRDGARTIGDSELIRQYLAVSYAIDFDRKLNARQRAAAHAFARMLEERTYWALVDSRWMNEANWPTVRDGFFGDLPFPISRLVPALMRRSVRARMRGQGLGLHSRETIEAFALDDLKAIADWLGDRPFMMGETPCSLDATVYGTLVSFVHPGFETPMREMIVNDMRLAGYLARCDALWFEPAGLASLEGCQEISAQAGSAMAA